MKKALFMAGIVSWVFFLPTPSSLAQMQNDIKKHPACQYCGMDRKHFAHSRMLVHHKDGKSVGVCSVFCAAKEYLRDPDEAPSSMKVADYNTTKLLDAVKAYWVMGGSKPGVMTNRAKWAFQDRTDALAFISKFGGELTDFGGVMKATYEDVYEDMRILKEMKMEQSRIRKRKAVGDLARNLVQ